MEWRKLFMEQTFQRSPQQQWGETLIQSVTFYKNWFMQVSRNIALVSRGSVFFFAGPYHQSTWVPSRDAPGPIFIVFGKSCRLCFVLGLRRGSKSQHYNLRADTNLKCILNIYRKTDQQTTFRQLPSQHSELLGVLEELDHVLQFVLGLLRPLDVLKRHTLHLDWVHLRVQAWCGAEPHCTGQTHSNLVRPMTKPGNLYSSWKQC